MISPNLPSSNLSPNSYKTNSDKEKNTGSINSVPMSVQQTTSRGIPEEPGAGQVHHFLPGRNYQPDSLQTTVGARTAMVLPEKPVPYDPEGVSPMSSPGPYQAQVATQYPIDLFKLQQRPSRVQASTVDAASQRHFQGVIRDVLSHILETIEHHQGGGRGYLFHPYWLYKSTAAGNVMNVAAQKTYPISGNIIEFIIGTLFYVGDARITHVGRFDVRDKQDEHDRRLSDLIGLMGQKNFLDQLGVALDVPEIVTLVDKLSRKLCVAHEALASDVTAGRVMLAKNVAYARDCIVAAFRKLYEVPVLIGKVGNSAVATLAHSLPYITPVGPLFTLLSGSLNATQGAVDLYNASRQHGTLNANQQTLAHALWRTGEIPPARWKQIAQHTLSHAETVRDLVKSSRRSALLRLFWAVVSIPSSIALLISGAVSAAAAAGVTNATVMTIAAAMGLVAGPVGWVLLSVGAFFLMGIGLNARYAGNQRKVLEKRLLAEFRLSQGPNGKRRDLLINAVKEVIKELRSNNARNRQCELERLKALKLSAELYERLEKLTADNSEISRSKDLQLAEELTDVLYAALRVPHHSLLQAAVERAYGQRGKRGNLNTRLNAFAFLAKELPKYEAQLLSGQPHKAKRKILQNLRAVEAPPPWISRLPLKEGGDGDVGPDLTRGFFKKYWSDPAFKNFLHTCLSDAHEKGYISEQKLEESATWGEAAQYYRVARRTRLLANNLLKKGSGEKLLKYGRYPTHTPEHNAATYVLKQLELNRSSSAHTITVRLQRHQICEDISHCKKQCLPLGAKSIRALAQFMTSCTSDDIEHIKTHLKDIDGHLLASPTFNKHSYEKVTNYAKLHRILEQWRPDTQSAVVAQLHWEQRRMECFAALCQHPTKKVLAALQSYPYKNPFRKLFNRIAPDNTRLSASAARLVLERDFDALAAETGGERWKQTMAFAKFLADARGLHKGAGFFARIRRFENWTLTENGKALCDDIDAQLNAPQAGRTSSVFSAEVISSALRSEDDDVKRYMTDWLRRRGLPNPQDHAPEGALMPKLAERVVAYEKKGGREIATDLRNAGYQAFATAYLMSKLNRLGEARWIGREMERIIAVWKSTDIAHAAVVQDIDVVLGRRSLAMPVRVAMPGHQHASGGIDLDRFYGVPRNIVPLYGNGKRPSRLLLTRLQSAVPVQRAEAAVMLLRSNYSDKTIALVTDALWSFTQVEPQHGAREAFGELKKTLEKKVKFYGEVLRRWETRKFKRQHYAQLIQHEIESLLTHARGERTSGIQPAQDLLNKFGGKMDVNRLFPHDDVRCLDWHYDDVFRLLNRSGHHAEEVAAIIERQRKLYGLDVGAGQNYLPDFMRMRAWEKLTRSNATKADLRQAIHHAATEPVVLAYIRHKVQPSWLLLSYLPKGTLEQLRQEEVNEVTWALRKTLPNHRDDLAALGMAMAKMSQRREDLLMATLTQLKPNGRADVSERAVNGDARHRIWPNQQSKQEHKKYLEIPASKEIRN